MSFTFLKHHMSKVQNLKVLNHIKNGIKCLCHSLMLIYILLDTSNHTIEHILQFINSDGACARRNGGQPSRRERAAADGPGRTGRAGACVDQYLKQQFYNTIYFNTFIKQFSNGQIPSIFFSVFLQISRQ